MRIATLSAVALAFTAAVAPRAGGAQVARTAAPAPRPVAELRFLLEPGRPRAGTQTTVAVSARDAEGKRTDAKVSVDCDFGELGEVTRVAEGLYQVTLGVPKMLPGHRSILLLARAGGISVEAVVPVAPGAPATLKLDAAPAVLADGEALVPLEVALLDAFGNAADDVPHASAGRGAVSPAEPIARGHWVIVYRPQRAVEGGEDVIAIAAGPLRREHRIRLDARARWIALAPWSGAARDGRGTALALGGAISGWRRTASGQLGVILDLAWWRHDERTALQAPSGTLSLEAGRSYLPLTASLAFARRVGSRGSATLAAGAGVSRVASAQDLSGQPAVSEAGFAPVLGVTAGLGLRGWRGSPYLELRGLWIGDAGLETLSGSTRALLLTVGYQLDAR